MFRPKIIAIFFALLLTFSCVGTFVSAEGGDSYYVSPYVDTYAYDYRYTNSDSLNGYHIEDGYIIPKNSTLGFQSSSVYPPKSSWLWMRVYAQGKRPDNSWFTKPFFILDPGKTVVFKYSFSLVTNFTVSTLSGRSLYFSFYINDKISDSTWFVNSTKVGSYIGGIYDTDEITFTFTNMTPAPMSVTAFQFGCADSGDYAGFVSLNNLGYHILTDGEQTIYNNEEAIKNQTEEIKANQDKNAQEIKDNQDKNTEEIKDTIEQQGEKEKEEANEVGNESASEVSSAVPDNSSGFISGMSSLISVMSYSGTECVWEMPQLYLPELPGVMNRIDLTEDSLDIDLGSWTERIPGSVMEIVQIVCTIALVVFCFKELYGTIQYVLTLKGGGDNE